MRRIDVSGLTLWRLTDAAPPPAEWRYAFPMAEPDDPALRRWAPDGRFHTAFTVHALAGEGGVTLVDLGLGPEPSAYFNGLAGRLDHELAAAGLTPDSVTTVMFTHFHLDHIGWASRGGEPYFPRARYVAPAAELQHWQQREAALPHHVAAFERHLAPLIASGVLRPLADGEPAPGAPALRFRAAPGHTPGHSAVVSADERLVIAGDAWHSPAQLERPAWRHRADRDPAEAGASAVALGRFAAERGALVAAGHFPDEQGFGHVVEDGEGMRWEPVQR